MQLEDFITKEEQTRIEQAVADAEHNTSGEVCVHITPHCRGNVMKRAVSTFNRLGLYRTRQRNCVLIFIAYASRKVAILGDMGINQLVPPDFWNDELVTLAQNLKAGCIAEGLCHAVAQIGDSLKAYFPPMPDDVNELPDKITYDNDEDT